MQRVEARRGAAPKFRQQPNTSGGGRCQVCSITLRQRRCRVIAGSGSEERCSPKVQANTFGGGVRRKLISLGQMDKGVWVLFC